MKDSAIAASDVGPGDQPRAAQLSPVPARAPAGVDGRAAEREYGWPVDGRRNTVDDASS